MHRVIHLSKEFIKNIYPILLASGIVLSYFTSNIDQLRLSDISLPLIIVILPTLFLYWIAYQKTRDIHIAGIITSFSILILFSFHLVFPAVRAIQNIGANWSFLLKISIIAGILFILLVSCILLMVRILPKHPIALKFYYTFSMIFSLVFFASQVFLILTRYHFFIDNVRFQKQWEQASHNFVDTTVLSSTSQKRDIYVIVLDSYPSTEVLQQIYGYDNTWFTNELKIRGFSVIQQARSNYPQTRTSTNALLNMQYLDNVPSMFSEQYKNTIPLLIMLEQNRVMRLLKKIGYKNVTYQTDYAFTNAIKGDINHKTLFQLGILNEAILTKLLFYPIYHNAMYTNHRGGITRSFCLNHYENGPTFQFVHVYAPHTPFVFDRNGQPLVPDYIYTLTDGDGLHDLLSTEEYLSGYPDQLEYISKKVLETIDNILNTSSTEPIIILMGDHGPGAYVNQVDVYRSNHFERMHILNALYLPGVRSEEIPNDLTPVNTFRFIFNQYFETRLPLLENRSFVSSYDTPYKFIDVTESLELDYFR